MFNAALYAKLEGVLVTVLTAARDIPPRAIVVAVRELRKLERGQSYRRVVRPVQYLEFERFFNAKREIIRGSVGPDHNPGYNSGFALRQRAELFSWCSSLRKNVMPRLYGRGKFYGAWLDLRRVRRDRRKRKKTLKSVGHF